MYDIFIVERYSFVVISKLSELKKINIYLLYLYSPNDSLIYHFYSHIYRYSNVKQLVSRIALTPIKTILVKKK